jgi:hypothetical protein
MFRFEGPSQCPLVILVDKSSREGKASGSEKGKGLGHAFFCEQREGFLRCSQDFTISVRPDGLCQLEKWIHVIGSATRDPPVSGTVPWPLRYRV